MLFMSIENLIKAIKIILVLKSVTLSKSALLFQGKLTDCEFLILIVMEILIVKTLLMLRKLI